MFYFAMLNWYTILQSGSSLKSFALQIDKEEIIFLTLDQNADYHQNLIVSSLSLGLPKCCVNKTPHLVTKCCLNETKKNFIGLSCFLCLRSVQNPNHVINASRKQCRALRLSLFIFGFITFTAPANKVVFTTTKFISHATCNNSLHQHTQQSVHIM